MKKVKKKGILQGEEQKVIQIKIKIMPGINPKLLTKKNKILNLRKKILKLIMQIINP